MFFMLSCSGASFRPRYETGCAATRRGRRGRTPTRLDAFGREGSSEQRKGQGPRYGSLVQSSQGGRPPNPSSIAPPPEIAAKIWQRHPDLRGVRAPILVVS